MSEFMVNSDRFGEPYIGTKEEFARILSPVLVNAYKNDMFFDGSKKDYIDQALDNNLTPATPEQIKQHPRIVALDPVKTQYLAEAEVLDVLENGKPVGPVHGNEAYTYDSGEKTTVAHEIVSRWMTRDDERSGYKTPIFATAPWSAKDHEGRSLAFAAAETAWIARGKDRDAAFIGAPKQIAEVRDSLVDSFGESGTRNIERQIRKEPSRGAMGLDIGDVLEGSVARRFYLTTLDDREFERRDDVYENYGFELFPRADADGGAFVATWAEVDGEMRLQQVRVIDDEAVSAMRNAHDDMHLEIWAAYALGQAIPGPEVAPINEASFKPLPDNSFIGDHLRNGDAKAFYAEHLNTEPFHGFDDTKWDQAYELFNLQGAGAIAKWQEVAGEMTLDTVTIISAAAREEIRQAAGSKDEVKTWRNHEIPGVEYAVDYDKPLDEMER